jgi:hypothetical protein
VDASYWLITVLSIGMLAGSIALQIRTYSRRRRVRPLFIVLGQAAAFGSMVLFSIILSRPPGVLEWALILTAGVTCGAAYGGLIRIEQTTAGIVMSYTLPWLLVWGALLLVTQGAAAITGRLPWVVYSLAIFTMTLNLGMNGRVVARYRGLRIGGATAAILLAPLLATAFSMAPSNARPALATSCSANQIPNLLRSLLPPNGLSGTMDFYETTESHLPMVSIEYISSHGQSSESYSIELYRSAADAKAARGSWIPHLLENPVETWEEFGNQGAIRRYWETTDPTTGTLTGKYDYVGISGAAYVELHHDIDSTDAAIRRNSYVDDLFSSLMAAAGRLNPDSVFALAATDRCQSVAIGTDEPGPNGSTPPGTPSAGGTPGGLSSIGDLLGGEPIKPGDLTQGLVLANGLLLLSSLGQLMLVSGGSLGGSIPGSSGGPANGTPVGDGRVWYRPPWDVGGPVPMNPAEVADIENKLRQGLMWSPTDGWVTRKQDAANKAMRAHQLEFERAESARAAAESHRAIQAARDAQAAARQEIRNINRRAVIDIEMRESERQHAEDMAELASADRAAKAWAVAEAAGDIAATGFGFVGGPLGLALRGGYRVLRGTAAGLGTGIADGASIGETTKRMYIGTVEGGVVATVELGIDAGVRKVSGLPPLFPADPPPIPPALLVPKAIMRQALGDAAEIAKTKGVDAAAQTVDPAKVLRLFKNGGMETLGQLEQAGAVSTSEAKVIRKVLSNHVNTAVAAGAGDAAREFAAKTGVRVTEVLVGDSGSSAAGTAGSLVTDADRTYVGVFHPDDLAAYAQQHGISPAAAAEQLNRDLTSAADAKVAEQLGNSGLTPQDVGYTGYSGFGSTAGPADSYAAGFTRTRQAVQGQTLVVRPDGTTYVAGKDAILDAEGLAAHAQGVPMPPAQPTVPLSEFGQLGGRQVESLVAHTDPKSVAKAMDRVSYLAGRTGIPVDSTAAGAAKAIRAEPQQISSILESVGLTPEEFRTRALDTTQRFMARLEDFGK